MRPEPANSHVGRHTMDTHSYTDPSLGDYVPHGYGPRGKAFRDATNPVRRLIYPRSSVHDGMSPSKLRPQASL
jgi:hypothetical protein